MFYYKEIIDDEIISVEAKSIDSISPHFVKATKAEYDNFIASMPEPPPLTPPRDLAAEIDEIKAELKDMRHP